MPSGGPTEMAPDAAKTHRRPSYWLTTLSRRPRIRLCSPVRTAGGLQQNPRRPFPVRKFPFAAHPFTAHEARRIATKSRGCPTFRSKCGSRRAQPVGHALLRQHQCLPGALYAFAALDAFSATALNSAPVQALAVDMSNGPGGGSCQHCGDDGFSIVCFGYKHEVTVTCGEVEVDQFRAGAFD